MDLSSIGKRGTWAAVITAAGLTVMGCDGPSTQSARSRASLNQAIEILTQANAGYSTEGGDQGYWDYRLKKLDEAEAKLQEVISQGDAFSKSEAQKLMAGLELARAQEACDAAEREFIHLSSLGVELFNYLQAVERIQSLITARSGDSQAVVSALAEGDKMVGEKKAAVTAQISELSAQRESATIEAEKRNAEAAELFGKSQQLDQQAFVAESDEHRQAAVREIYRSEIQGQAALRKAREAQIEADHLGNQIAALQTEASLWDQMGQEIGQLQTQVRENGEAAAQDVSKAGSDKDLGLATVRQKLEAMNNVFKEQVQSPLDRAAGLAQSAHDRFGQASDRAARQAAQFDQLTAQTELAQILSLHANFAHDYAILVKAVASNPSLEGTSMSQSLQSLSSGLTEQSQAKSEQARGVINDGQTLAESLAGDSPLGNASTALAESLQAYGQRLN